MFAVVVFVLLSPSAIVADDDPVELLKDAARLQNDGKFAEAAVRWQRFIRDNDKDAALPRAYQGLGTCLLETGEFDRAIAALDKALMLWPQGESTWTLRWNRSIACYRRAERTLTKSDLEEAGRALQILTDDKETPADRRALVAFYLARTEQVQGKTDAARKRYLSLLEGKADSTVTPHVLLALAALGEQAKDWKEARGRYEAFLRDHQEHASAREARLGLADVLLQLNQDEEAERLFGQFAQQSEKHAAADYARFRWGEIAFRRARFALAADRLGPFVKIDVKSAYRANALILLGDAQLQVKDHTKARDAFDHFLRDYADHAAGPHARLGVCLCLFETGKIAKAEEQLQAFPAGIKDETLRVQVAVLVARCAAGSKRWREAVERFAAVFDMKSGPGDPEQVRLEGVEAAFLAGDDARGIAWVRHLEEQHAGASQTSRARLVAARWLADKGRYEASLPYCRSILNVEKAAERPAALFLAGFCSMKVRKFEDAIKSYDVLLKEYPRFEQAAAACFSLGLGHESLGQTTKAVEVYRRFLDAYPADALASKVKQRLESLSQPRE